MAVKNRLGAETKRA